MKLSYSPRWMLALAWIIPSALAAQSHGLEPKERVRIQYAGLDGSHVVEGRIGSATKDSVVVKPRDIGARTIAWADVELVSVRRPDPPRRNAMAVLGGMAGALVGGFASVGRAESMAVGNRPIEQTVFFGVAGGVAIGAVAGVGLSYLVRTRSWHTMRVHPVVSSRRGGVGMSFAVPLGRP